MQDTLPADATPPAPVSEPFFRPLMRLAHDLLKAVVDVMTPGTYVNEQPRDKHHVPVRDRGTQPRQRNVTVVLVRESVDSPWINERWQLRAVMPGQERPESGVIAKNPHGGQSTVQPTSVRYDGLRLVLYADESESYYHNLNVAEPRCYVVLRQEGDAAPEPVLVTASFDAANAYAEGDDLVDTAPLDPLLYLWIEEFVLTHYVPTERKKRKREPWKRS